MFEAEFTVRVVAHIKGKDYQRELGYCHKPVYVLKDGEWVKTGKTEILFGYVKRGHLTHMSYTLNTHHHETWNDWISEWKHDRFYFDAGSNGCPIYVLTNTVGAALIELGLIDTSKEDAFTPNPPCDCKICTGYRTEELDNLR